MPAVPNVRAEQVRGRPVGSCRFVAACMIVLAACGGAQVTTPGPDQPANACIVATRSDTSDQPITVGLTEPVDPAHAPEPHTESERILFRLLYETLVSVDCSGRIYPGLANGWRSEEQNRVWIFTLREHAAFWDGEPVSPYDVVTSWRSRAAAGELVPRDSVTVRGDREVRVAFTGPRASSAIFAHPALAITRRITAPEWPVGTTPLDVELGPAAYGGAVRIHDRQRRRPLVEFDGSGSADARDFLDRGVEILVTEESTALDYAVTRASEFTSVPLPWNRTYVVLAPDRIHGSHVGAFPGRLLNDLAGDAVRVEAQAAPSPFWWEDMSLCEFERPIIRQPRASSAGVTRRVVYNATDETARNLAERLVALAGSRDGGQGLAFIGPTWSDQSKAMQALGVDPEQFWRSVNLGSESGYVLALPRFVLDPCAEAATLITRVPWLMSASSDSLSVDFSRAIVPMVDVRSRAVLRRGRVSATTDWDGTLRVVVP